MLGVQVNLVLGTVQAEADRTVSVAAVNVIDEQGLHFLCHGCSISRADGNDCRQFRRHEHAATPALLGPGGYAPLVKATTTMLWMWGRGRPCGPQWCSKEAASHRCGLTAENLLRPVSCKNSSAA